MVAAGILTPGTTTVEPEVPNDTDDVWTNDDEDFRLFTQQAVQQSTYEAVQKDVAVN